MCLYMFCLLHGKHRYMILRIHFAISKIIMERNGHPLIEKIVKKKKKKSTIIENSVHIKNININAFDC